MKRAKWLLKKYGFIAAVVVIVGLFLAWKVPHDNGKPQEMALTEMLARAEGDGITKASIDSGEHRLTVTLGDGTKRLVNYPAEYDDELTDELISDGVDVTSTHVAFWTKYGVVVWTFGGLAALVLLPYVLPRVAARLAVRKKQVTDVPSDRLADVEGAPEAVEELKQLVDFLKNPDRYTEAGVRVPRGWLFDGPPGTGKTLTARAVAGEAGVPFFYMSASELVAKFYGEGAERVRALFDRARTASYDGPSIVFIDEIDAIGATRGSDDSGGGHEYSVTLNQMLTEMDGFMQRESKVIVIGATNRRDMLDPALLRAGRLTRHVTMPEPDIAAREAVLRKHASALAHLDSDVDFTTLARITNGRSGADLAEMANAAGLLALRQGSDAVTTEHFKEALATAVMGHARTSAQVADDDRKITGTHEGGHALAAFLLPKAREPHQVTIVPRGDSGGATWMLGEDRQHITADAVLDELTVAMAGHAAERLCFGEGFSASGATHDRQTAGDLALRAVCEWGLGSLEVKVDVHHWTNDPRASQIARDVDGLVHQAFNRALELLAEHRPALEALTAKLLEVETISGEDVKAIVGDAAAAPELVGGR